ncbi:MULTISPECIES: hypothetical protein [Rhodomicrobium]|uniref:hypothetical protein n=1 Tax=Rhodomicrobium TaxID=1068 RepID=UPI000B4BF733|nr:MULTISPECIES: hypothetical protein [Rhodomicrobium]
MQIKIKPEAAGQYNAYQGGDILDVPDEVAQRLIARGIADAVETQVAGPSETATGKAADETQVPLPGESR